MPLDDGILAGVANANFKTLAEAATQNLVMAQQLATTNAIANQQAVNLIGQSSLGQMLNRMNSLDPEEAAAIAGVVTSDIAEKLGELGGTVSAIQQMIKGAGNTPPVTP